jgi:choline transport protein
MAITLIFTLGDVDSLFESVTRQPFIQLFYNATQSHGGTNAMTAIVIILLSACCTSEVATASRQLWSFGRDQGLPGSRWLSQVGHCFPSYES